MLGFTSSMITLFCAIATVFVPPDSSIEPVSTLAPLFAMTAVPRIITARLAAIDAIVLRESAALLAERGVSTIISSIYSSLTDPIYRRSSSLLKEIFLLS